MNKPNPSAVTGARSAPAITLASNVEVASVIRSSVQWRKSRNSDNTGGACVEVALVETLVAAEWRKSSRSTNTGGQCVEVADLAVGVAVRDSKDPHGPKLIFGSSAWRAFATQVKNGTLDLA